MSDDFPTPEQLRAGCLAAAIIHAAMNTRYPDLSAEQSWDGMNYSVQDSQGGRGTITFAPNEIIGAFFDAESPANPFRSHAAYDLDAFLKGMPEKTRRLAELEALQYVLQDHAGTTRPIITAAVWKTGDRLTGAAPWAQIFKHGAHLIQRQLLPIDQAWRAWQEYYEMSDAELSFVQALVDKRATKEKYALNAEEKAFLTKNAQDRHALEECRSSLEEIRISWGR